MDQRTSFGVLRSLLHHWEDTPDWRLLFWSLVQSAQRHFPTSYFDQWLPYIEDFELDWSGALASATSLEELKEMAATAPFARFELELVARLPGQQDAVRALARDPLLRHVASLLIGWNHLSTRELCALCDSPHLLHLGQLDLEQNDFHADVVRAMASIPALQDLRRLNASSHLLGDQGGVLLATSPLLAHIKELKMSFCNFTSASAHALAHSEHTMQLEALDLSLNEFTAPDLVRLTRSPRLDALHTLDLSMCVRGRLTGAAERRRQQAHYSRLFDARSATGLRTLRLSDNALGEAGVSALASASCLDGVQELGVSVNELGEGGVRELLKAPFVASLRSLDLRANDLGVRAMRYLRRAPLSALQALELRGNPLGDAGARVLASGAHLKELRTLGLEQCGVSAQAARELAASSAFAAGFKVELGEGSGDEGAASALRPAV